MADYRGRSRRSESSSGSSSSGGSGQYYQTTSRSSGNSNLSYPPITSGDHSYYSAAPNQQASSQTPYGHYTASSPPFQPSMSTSGYGHRTSSSGHPHHSGAVPRHSTYPNPVASTAASERASKRQRAATTGQGYIPAEWTDTSGQAYSPTGDREAARGLSSPHGSGGSRYSEREGSASSGYTSPTYSHGTNHDPYGRQLLQPPSSVPGVGPSTIRDPHLYGTRYSPRASSDDDDENVDHGPTELPPRTYSGKSRYDPPKKPGKIPGSAMDYLPILEARFDRLETAIDRYVDYRGQRALSNSILPGMDTADGSSNRGGSSSSRRSRGSSRR